MDDLIYLQLIAPRYFDKLNSAIERWGVDRTTARLFTISMAWHPLQYIAAGALFFVLLVSVIHALCHYGGSASGAE